tara:strand:+ start:23210 stop:23500 length:291 start_codon:yes stop_codon:yes gene_type:complete
VLLALDRREMVIDIKTETKRITSHKVGVYMTISELDRCIISLSEQPSVDEDDRILANELANLARLAKDEIKKRNNDLLLNKDRPTINDDCKSGVCD